MHCFLSCNCQRSIVVQVDSATGTAGNRYSVTELTHHQECTAVMPTPYVMSLFLRRKPSRAGLDWPGRALVQASIYQSIIIIIIIISNDNVYRAVLMTMVTARVHPVNLMNAN